MVLKLDFDVGKRDDGKVHVHAAVAQFDHLGGESRVCFFPVSYTHLVLSGYKGGQGIENHLGKNMDGTRRRIRAVFPQLVDTGSAAAGGIIFCWEREYNS